MTFSLLNYVLQLLCHERWVVFLDEVSAIWSDEWPLGSVRISELAESLVVLLPHAVFFSVGF